MDGKPSGLPSSSGGKGKGVAIVGANPWYSDDGSDGSKSSSESERTVTDDFRIFVHSGHGDQEVDSRKANRHEENSETNSERTEGVGFGKIANSTRNSRHLSDADSGLRPAEKKQKSARFQPEILTMVIYSQRILSGDNSYGANSGHRQDADSGMLMWSSGKKQVKDNKDIPESWKVHPRKDEVDPKGWDVEIYLRNDLKTKDKYYRHKDYNHKFRSKREVQYFLDTGKVIVRKVPCILQKRSADASVPSRGSGTSPSGGKGPAAPLQLPHGFV
uniref:MBD domain-containing protein n=1 Tax=Oryza punctata TaxID=4537 RepID=A0A0E0LZD8_ORYPU